MSFDAIAPHYNWLEAVLAGGKLHRCRTAFLDAIPVPRAILLMGEGHGRSLVECCRRFPSARVTYVDASQAMLRQAAKSLESESIKRVKFIHADVRGWRPDGECFDLIVTNFFLDCFSAGELEQVLASLTKSAARNASWLIADFQQAGSGIQRWRNRVILWLMYRAFRVLTNLPANKLTPPDSILSKLGFTLRSRVQTEWDLLHSDWWQRQELADLSEFSCSSCA